MAGLVPEPTRTGGILRQASHVVPNRRHSKKKGEQLKLRLIHDLRRSGVNSRVSTHERVILRRIRDAKENILDLIDRCGAQQWEAYEFDFKDAFKQIQVHP